MPFHPMMMGAYGPWSMAWNGPPDWRSSFPPFGYFSYGNGAYAFTPTAYNGDLQNTRYGTNRNGNYGYRRDENQRIYGTGTHAVNGYEQKLYGFDGKRKLGDNAYGKADHWYGDSFFGEPVHARPGYDSGMTRQYEIGDKLTGTKWARYPYGYGQDERNGIKDKYSRNEKPKLRVVQVIRKKLYKPRDRFYTTRYNGLKSTRYVTDRRDYDSDSGIWSSPWYAHGQSELDYS